MSGLQNVTPCQAIEVTIDRSRRLVGKMGGEGERWTQELTKLKALDAEVVGNSTFAAGVLTYCGAFTGQCV